MMDEGDVRLIHGDCLDVMEGMGEKSVDFVLADLPYAVTANRLDVSIPFAILWERLKRVAKDNAVIALFAQGLFYVDLVNSNRDMFRYDLVWDKVLTTGFLNANKMPLRRHEQIAVFYEGTPKYRPQFSVGEPSHSRGAKYFEKPVTNRNYGEFRAVETKFGGRKHPTSIIRFRKPHPSVARHRTEKPRELLEWLIKMYTDEGDVVLDCTAGSFSCGVAAVRCGRRFVGIEKDEETFRKGRERVLAEMRSSPLFYGIM